ncbi:VWA domain-containing protein [Myxococcota bacterium]|nr:VWA domain-containing protein [Myxococcota bacterium]
MSDWLAWPAALFGALAVPAFVLLHRRARPRGERPFTAFFLLPPEVLEGLAGRRWRSPLLLLLRVLAALLLVTLAAGPVLNPPGTLVVTSGPVTPEADWQRPITYVRAGSPPAVSTTAAPERILPVAGEPEWAASTVLGRRVAPEARLVYRVWQPAARIPGAGAQVDGATIRVAADVDGPGAVTLLDAGGTRHALDRRGRAAAFRGLLPPGGATIEVAGALPYPVCVPVAGPVTVSDAGWPTGSGLDEAFAALESLDLVRRVPWERATWQPASEAPPPPPGTPVAAPFGPDVTRVFFSDGPRSRTAAALVPEGDLPAPGAIVRAFEPLEPAGRIWWRAAESPVVDSYEHGTGRTIRFGFQPADSDLPDTAVWPVFIARLLDDERTRRARCRVHEAGRPLSLAADGPVTVVGPDGTSRTVDPTGGVVHLDGLDAQGLVHLTSQGVRATLAVVPGTVSGEPEPPVSPSVPGTPAPRPPPPPGLFALALLAVAATLVVGRRGRALAAWGAVAATVLAAFDPRPGPGRGDATVVAVDISASVDRLEARAHLGTILGALGGDDSVRIVEGDDGVRAVDPARPLTGPGGNTRAAPLLRAAAALAGDGGAIVYLGDGLAPDLPVPLAVPVYSVPVGTRAPDVAVTSARAIRIGEVAYVHATFEADTATTAEVEIDRVTTELPLEAGRPRTLTARVRPGPGDEIVVRAQVAGDPRGENDVVRVPVPPPPSRTVAVIAEGSGAGPMAWAAAAGLSARVYGPDALATEDRMVWSAGALWIHDVPAERLPPSVGAPLTGFVRGGGTLLLSGRSRAFGTGGWGGTPLEALSPVTVDPRPPGAGRLAVALLLDRSGSMSDAAGGIGTEAVGRLARGLAAGLRPQDDHLAVLGFGTQAHVLLPPTPAGALAGRTLPVPDQARGGTRLRPALLAGLETLVATEADTRILVVVSDGKFADADGELPVDALRAASVRVLAVLVGAEADPALLEDLARATGGDWVAGRADEVLRLGAAGVSSLAGGGLLAGPAPVTPGAAWSVRVGGPTPAVPGRVRVRERPTARVLARAEGDPLLAEWQVGAGRVIALATDDWGLSTAGWGTLLAPVGAGRRGAGDVAVDGRRLVVRADAPADGPVDPPSAVVSGTGFEPIPLRLTTEGPGRWSAPLPDRPRAGPWTAAVDLGGERLTLRFAPPLPAELRPAPPDLVRLDAQAVATGGMRFAEPGDVAAMPGRTHRGGTPIGPWLLLLAVVALLVDAAQWAGLILVRRAPGGRARPDV